MSIRNEDYQCSDCGCPIRIDVVKGRCTKCYARYLRVSKRIKTRSCQVCKYTFQSPRSDARFCCDACRQAAYRFRAISAKAKLVKASHAEAPSIKVPYPPAAKP